MYRQSLNKSGGADKLWSDVNAGFLEAAIVNGAPTQAKLEQLDLAVDSRCQWCLQAKGDSMRRTWACDGTRNFRDTHGHCDVISREAALAHGDPV